MGTTPRASCCPLGAEDEGGVHGESGGGAGGGEMWRREEACGKMSANEEAEEVLQVVCEVEGGTFTVHRVFGVLRYVDDSQEAGCELTPWA
eukprot:831580-Prorocentrum_minimum.AAC.2